MEFQEFEQEVILKAAKEASSSLLPQKSRDRYEKTYSQFCDWRKKKEVEGVDENIMLAYFFEKVNDKSYLLNLYLFEFFIVG